jgi:hypothetical protein
MSVFLASALTLPTFCEAHHLLQATCTGFDVSQDVGMGVYAWANGLSNIYIPGVEINPDHEGYKILRPGLLAVHSVSRNFECNNDSGAFSDSLGYRQDPIIGCGSVDENVPSKLS